MDISYWCCDYVTEACPHEKATSKKRKRNRAVRAHNSSCVPSCLYGLYGEGKQRHSDPT